MDTEELKILEEAVERMLQRYQAVCAERDRYRAALDEANARVRELTNEVEGYRAERERLRERVGRLVRKLDSLEAA